MMMRSPGIWPQWIKRISLFFSKNSSGSMGTPSELMEQISALFPSVRWEKVERAEIRSMLGRIKGAQVDPNAPVWFGRGGPEFQLSADTDGHVKSMTVSRAEPHEVHTLHRRLGLVYLDLQADGVLGMLFS